MTTQAMTSAQENLILTLAGKITGRPVRFLSQCSELLPVSNSAIRRGLTKAEASTCIDNLQARATAALKPAQPDTEPQGMDATTAISLLGKKVTLVGATGAVTTGWIDAIQAVDGRPAFCLTIAGKPVTRWLDRITSWDLVN
jgi:hypothetical protein